MNYSLSITADSIALFKKGVIKTFDDVKEPVQASMAEKFFEIVRSNFGDYGVDRPIDWAPLSNRAPYFYATKVGREHATLFVTGRLEAGVKFEADQDRGRVYISDSDVPYATRHQYGDPSRNLPARPYFPIDSEGNVMPFTQKTVQESAEEELFKLLS